MSIIRADSIKNRVGDGAPDFPNGITVTGIVTATSLQTNVASLNVGSNIQLGNAGIITATSYRGDGSQLTGVDATALKDGSSNVIVQASSSAVTVTAGKHLNPASTNTTDLGTTSLRWRNLYTQDLQLSNESSDGNDVDGTWGDWTLQEGETDIFMINNRTGKKYKINMTEVN
tara:strand:+ start:171 stop:689 length:519 start_codon:yes stop_codon:yes gene_type:complete